MSVNSRDDDLPQDNDPTDELPILMETAVLDPVLVSEAIGPRGELIALDDSTGEHTVLYPPPLPARAIDADALERELASRALQVEGLEAELRKLSARWLDLERQLNDKEVLIQDLSATVTTVQQALDDRAAAQQALEEQIAAQQAAIEEQRRHASGIEAQLAAVRTELAAELAKPKAPSPDERLQALQEELATLTGYIANRRSHWNELEARTRAADARIGELERELAHRATRQQVAEQTAQSETARAESFRRELIDASRALEARDQEVANLRAAADHILAQTAEPVPAAPTAPPGPASPAASTAQAAPAAPRAEIVGHLEAELERQRADVERLEHALLDKDRSLDARNERLAALQQELDQKLATLQRNDTPALVCLSSDSPQHHALRKATMTIGRGPHCDIQVFTHFVSREHAKLTIERSRVIIEDLGSTNGVFVNAVRVDRQELRHSDLVTVGETQFRFVERMAH